MTALAWLMVGGGVWAKPMLPPTLEQALRSPFIVIAEYLGPLAGQQVSYFSGVRVQYTVVEVLKGTPAASTFSVRYLFNDGSACVEPEGWAFEKEPMPVQRSRWILFLEGTEDSGALRTYRGSFGRKEATQTLVAEVRRRLGLPGAVP